MKHIIPYNFFILEKKADVTTYQNKSELGLVRKQLKRNNTTSICLTLYDFKDDIVLGHIELDNLKIKSEFEVMRACAKKDWGAVIYDYALMDINPLPVVPSKVIMPKAINIWRYYYELRSDVKKKAILPEDESYSTSYRNFLDDTPKSDDNLKYLNCYYFMDKSNDYIELIENGKILLEKYNKKSNEITNKGFKEFEKVYEH